MTLLSFIKTNAGVAALRRHENAETLYFTQVWFREKTGEWKKRHYFSKEKDADFSSGLLEAIYGNLSEQELPYEDGW